MNVDKTPQDMKIQVPHVKEKVLRLMSRKYSIIFPELRIIGLRSVITPFLLQFLLRAKTQASVGEENSVASLSGPGMS